MIGQQMYWKSVWSDTVKKSGKKARLDEHTKEEEKLYRKIMKRAKKRKAGRA